jgi:hypothetical protein
VFGQRGRWKYNSLKLKKDNMTGDVAEGVEWLPCKCEALSSNPSTEKKRFCKKKLINNDTGIDYMMNSVLDM